MRLLDLFCGAGGASMGYHEAGFDVVGVDIKPQPNYPFEFHQADALTFPLDGFDVIHASPPCQRFSKSVSKKNRENHPDLIAAIRQRLTMNWPAPYVIENVPGSPLIEPVVLCGTMFRLDVKRHRLFESDVLLPTPPACRHGEYAPKYPPAWNRKTLLRFRPISGGWTGASDIEDDRKAMGVDWPMTRSELSESIPPAYTKWIGRWLMEELT